MRWNSNKLRLLVIADFALEEGRTVSVESQDIDALLEQLAPSSTLRVRNRLSGKRNDELECNCEWRALKDFSPAALAESIPILSDLQDARRQLADAENGPIDLQAIYQALPASVRQSDLGSRLRQASAEPRAAGGDRIDSLLAQVEVPGEEPAKVLADLRAEIDRRLNRQLKTLLADPRWRTVETAWRSLAFLLAQEGAAGSSIELLSATKDGFLQCFFDGVFQREYSGEVDSPLAAVVLGYPFDRSLADLDRLAHAAQMGESLRVPFLASMGAGYWGLKRAALLSSLPDPENKIDGPEYAKWNRLRAEEKSLWLTLTMNRFVLRGAWGTEEPIAETDLAWLNEGADDEALWGEGSWALAAVLAEAIRRGGLSLPMTEVDLAELRCRPYGGRRSAPFDYPLEARLPNTRSLDFAACGFAPLTAEKGQASASFAYLPCFHRARRYTTNEATRASYQAATLPYQLFAALASRELQEAGETIRNGLSEDDIAEHFQQRFRAFLDLPDAAAGNPEVTDTPEVTQTPDVIATDEADATNDEVTEPIGIAEPVSIEVADDPENAHYRLVTVRLQPRFEVCGGKVDLVLGTQVSH